METLPALKTIPNDHEMMVYHTMAENAVASKMYKGIGEKSAVMMIMLSARELGIPPMQALNGGINIIQGKVEISARMMSGMIRRAGHHISIKESTESLCTLVGKRSDTGDTATVSYTLVEAQKAGLVKSGGGWSKCPKDMCFARAISRLGRQLFSDVIGIGYVEGEIKASDGDVVVPDDLPPVAPTVETTSEEDLITKYVDLFDQEDKFLALEYLQDVMNHFSWDKTKAIETLAKDNRRLQEKFVVWKNIRVQKNG